MINMQELQIKSKDDEFSLDILKDGHSITSYQVQKMLNEFFDTRTPGLPYFKPKRINKYNTSNKDDWNVMFSTMKEDLENAYIIYNNQSDYGTVIQNDYDMRMEYTNKAIDSLVMETQLLEQYIKKKTAYSPYIINFSDLKDVNMRNLVVNNIPYTTSEIDYDSSSLRNELQSTPNDKVDLTGVSIKIEGTHARISYDKDISNITSETLNNTVTVTSTSSSKKAPEITMTFTLAEDKEVSRIDMKGYSLYNTDVTLYVSEDGNNFFEKETGPGDPNMIWRFNSEIIKAFKIVLVKNSYDYESADGNECYYMFSNLSLYLDKYKKTSVFTSSSLEIQEVISDVTLSPVQECPPQTNIAYFVGVENKDNNVEWKAIAPDTKLDLKLLYNEEKIVNYETTSIKTFGARRYDKVNSQYYFRIYQLPTNTNLNSIYLRAGHSQWLLERLNVTDKYTPGHPTDNKCHTNDYSKSRVSEISALDSTIMDVRCEKDWNYFVMSQYAICEKDTIIENRYMEFDIVNEVFDVLLLINGKQIFSKNKKYAFKLKKGENLIQIMVLLGNHTVTDASGHKLEVVKKIRHNFNLLTYCKTLYAGPEMERINYNSLLKNISSKSLKYYAIKEENLKDIYDVYAADNFVNMIVSKFDPNFVLKPVDPLAYDDDSVEVNNPIPIAATILPTEDVSTITFDDIVYDPNYDENNDVIIPIEGEDYPQYVKPDIFLNNSEYMRMYIKFKHMLPETKIQLTNADGNSNIRLRIMAKLSTGDVTVSPVIKAIKVIGE